MPSAILDPTYIRKNSHGKEGHSPSKDNFGEHLHEPKKLTPLLELRADKSGGACSDCLILTDLTLLNMVICRKVGPTRRVTARQATPLGKPTVFCHVNGSLRFARKCRKSWIAHHSFPQGSSGVRVNLLPGKSFLHINGALVKCKYNEPRSVTTTWYSIT